MKARRSDRMCLCGVVTIVVLFLCSAPVSAGAYRLTAAGERLEFVPQAEKGYVIKLAEKTGGIHALAGVSALHTEDARPVRGLDRHGVWTVENKGPASRNEDTIRSLRAGGQVAYAAPLFSSNGETVAIIPEIVVRVEPGTEMEQLKALCEKAGCTIRKRMEFTQQEYLLEVFGADAEAVFAAVKQLGQAPCVEWACPNTASQPRPCGQAMLRAGASGEQLYFADAEQVANSPGVFPNDEYFPRQWHLHNTGQSGGTPGADIRAPEAWEITTGDPNITVALPDSGVDSNHPDLADNLVSGYDFYEKDDQPDPSLDHFLNTHGTACAGLVAAKGNNALGVTGVTWDCKIMPIKVETVAGLCSDADIATAFRWMASNGADVITNSWGYGRAVPITHSAIIDVTRPDGLGRGGRGCVVTAGSGNGGGNNIGYIARYREVIAVGATNHNDMRCSYSSYGPDLDITAPGGEEVQDPNLFIACRGLFWTTDISGSAGRNMPFDPNILNYSCGWGTSFSSPIAAGVAALILSVEPNLTSDEVRHFLERSAKDLGNPGRDDYYGWGRVDARAALDMVLAKRADLNNDWKVDEEDRAILMRAIDANDLSADIAPAAKRDGKVHANDLALLTQYLGTVIPELGLIAHWKLDEASGTVAADSAGTSNGALAGNPVWQPAGGKLAGALQLDGVDDCVTTEFLRDPSEGALSVFAWVKGGAPGQVILSQAGGVNWLMAGASDGGLATELKARRIGNALKSTASVTDGAWHRVGLSWDGSNRSLYVDGVEVATDTQANLPSSDGGLYIGAGSTLAPGSFWSGLLDDVRTYDRAVKP